MQPQLNNGYPQSNHRNNEKDAAYITQPTGKTRTSSASARSTSSLILRSPSAHSDDGVPGADSHVIAPHPGCLILGTDASRGNKYVTRYRIDRQAQREEVGADTRIECCCPCRQPEKRQTWPLLLVTIVTSEPLILTLHITVLVLGVLKEALDLRTVDEDLHFVHSLVETIVACLVVMSRLVGAWTGYKDFKKHRARTQYGHSGTNPTSTRLFTFCCVFLLAFSVGAFLFFYFFAHLGWTILSNNFVLLVLTVTYSLATERLRNQLARDRTDQHKAIICEMFLINSELHAALANDTTTRSHALPRVRNVSEKYDLFCRAVRDTDTFSTPEYITCPSGMAKDDMITHMEMQSFV